MCARMLCVCGYVCECACVCMCVRLASCMQLCPGHKTLLMRTLCAAASHVSPFVPLKRAHAACACCVRAGHFNLLLQHLCALHACPSLQPRHPGFGPAAMCVRALLDDLLARLACAVGVLPEELRAGVLRAQAGAQGVQQCPLRAEHQLMHADAEVQAAGAPQAAGTASVPEAAAKAASPRAPELEEQLADRGEACACPAAPPTPPIGMHSCSGGVLAMGGTRGHGARGAGRVGGRACACHGCAQGCFKR